MSMNPESNADQSGPIRRDKSCPVCDKTTWDYDVVEYGTGERFCGECLWATNHIASRLAKCPIFLKPATQKTWARAIRLARSWRHYTLPDTDTIDMLLVQNHAVRASDIPTDTWKKAQDLRERGLE